MSISGRQVQHYVILDAKATTGVGVSIPVMDYRNAVVKIWTSGSANLTVKAQGAVTSPTTEFTAPDFSASQTIADNWDYVQMIDLNDGTPINGDTGFVVTGTDDFRLFEVNINGLDYLTFNVTARSAGAVTVVVQLSNNV